MAFQEKDSSIKRPSPNREPRHRILIVCEGESTEPVYFKSFQHSVKNRLVHVEINDDSGVPKTLVERYGTPNYVGIAADWGPGPLFSLIIYYDEMDLIVEYWGVNIIPAERGVSQI